MKKQVDKNERHLEFAVGDLVLVKLQPYIAILISFEEQSKAGNEIFWTV